MRAPLLAAVGEILNSQQLQTTCWPQLPQAWCLIQQTLSNLNVFLQQPTMYRSGHGHALLPICAAVPDTHSVAECQNHQHQTAVFSHQSSRIEHGMRLTVAVEQHRASSRSSNRSLHPSQAAAAETSPQRQQQQPQHHQQQQQQQHLFLLQPCSRSLLQVDQASNCQLQLQRHHHHHQQQQMCIRESWPLSAAVAGAQGCRYIHSSSASKAGRDPKSGPRGPPPPKPKPQPEKKAEPRHNEQIRAPRLLVIFPDDTKQVLDNAAAKAAAASLNLDLVELNARSDPPVVRILDYRQYRYKQQKKAEEAEKQKRLAQKMATPKEMQFSARIGDHDLEFKLKKVLSMLEDGYKVQLTVKYKRDEDAAAAEAIDYLLARIQSEFAVEAGAKQAQRRAVTMLVKPVAAKQ